MGEGQARGDETESWTHCPLPLTISRGKIGAHPGRTLTCHGANCQVNGCVGSSQAPACIAGRGMQATAGGGGERRAAGERRPATGVCLLPWKRREQAGAVLKASDTQRSSQPWTEKGG